MRLYHRTPAAEAILEGGFRDITGFYLTSQLWTGVWLSNRPLDANEDAKGEGLLTLNIPESVIAEYEWVGEGKPYREFLVPAEIVNSYGPPERVDEWA